MSENLATTINKKVSDKNLEENIKNNFFENGELDKQKIIQTFGFLNSFEKARVSEVLGRDLETKVVPLYEEALEKAETKAKKYKISVKIGHIKYESKKYEEAKKYYDLSLDNADTKKKIFNSNLTLGNIEGSLRNYEKAKYYSKKALENAKTDRDKYLSNFALGLSEFYSKNYVDAIDCYKKVPDNYKPEMFRFVADAYYENKDYSNALKYYENFLAKELPEIETINEKILEGNIDCIREKLNSEIIPKFDIILEVLIKAGFIKNHASEKFKEGDYLEAKKIIEAGDFKYKDLLLAVLNQCIEHSEKQ